MGQVVLIPDKGWIDVSNSSRYKTDLERGIIEFRGTK
jgi:hypothetical protein